MRIHAILPSAHTRGLAFFLFGALALSFGFNVAMVAKGTPLIPPGPGVALAFTTKAIWTDGTLESEHARQAFRIASTISRKEEGIAVSQDVFAIGANGKLYPKHSIFTAISAVPLFALFGVAGFWIYQQMTLLLLLFSLYSLVTFLARRTLPWATLITICLGLQTLLYTHNFNYELHAAALLICGFHLSRREPLLGGVVMALSALVKPYFLLIAFPLSLIWQLHSEAKVSLRDSLLGATIGLGLLLAANHYLWGGIFEFSYTRIPIIVDGQAVISTIPVGFDFQTLASDWGAKLWGVNGLLPFNLALFGLPWVIRTVQRHPERRMLTAILVVAFVFSIYIFSYPEWKASFHGNRFLLAALMLYAIPCSICLGQFEPGRRKGPE